MTDGFRHAAASQPYSGVRVLVVGRDLAAVYAAMLLGDLGADVVVASLPQSVEPPHNTGLDPWFERMVRSSVRWIQLDSDWLVNTIQLTRLADVVIESVATEFASELQASLQAHSRSDSILCSVSGMGRAGPAAHLDACELLVQARSSYMNLTGFPERPPTMAGTALASYYTGAFAAIEIAATLFRRRRLGVGAHIDVSRLDCMVSALEGTVEHYFEAGRFPRRSGNVHMNIPSGYGIYPTGDGFLAIGVVGEPIWRRFCKALSADELLNHQLLATPQLRRQYPELIDEILLPWLSSRSRDEAVAILTESGVPCAPVLTVKEVFEARTSYTGRDRDGPATGSSFHFSRSTTKAPSQTKIEVTLDKLVNEWSASVLPLPAEPVVSPGRPLDGLTVLDMGTIVAGPYCGMILGDLGASVVKVQAPSDQDGRLGLSGTRKIRGRYEIVLVGSYRDREKRSVTIDLKTEQGKVNLRQLCRSADLLIENFAPGTLEDLGVGIEDLVSENPRLGYVGIKLYAPSAASADEVGFDLIAEARSGFASLTGFPGDPPTKSGQSASDYLSGALAALSGIAILFERECSGAGQSATVSLFESLLYAMDGELERVADGEASRERLGLMSRQHAERCALWRCQDGYVAIDVTKDADLASLHRTIHVEDESDWTTSLVGWSAIRTRREAALALSDEGIPAAAVNTLAETCGDPQLWWRGMFVPVRHGQFGGLIITGSPMQIDDERVPITRVGPAPGESNQRLLGSLNG